MHVPQNNVIWRLANLYQSILITRFPMTTHVLSRTKVDFVMWTPPAWLALSYSWVWCFILVGWWQHQNKPKKWGGTIYLMRLFIHLTIFLQLQFLQGNIAVGPPYAYLFPAVLQIEMQKNARVWRQRVMALHILLVRISMCQHQPVKTLLLKWWRR